MDFSRLSQTDLSKAIGVPARTIRSWEDIPRNPDRTYSLPAVVQWLLLRADESDSAAPADPESQGWLAKLRRERYKLSKIERLKAEGSLIPRADIGAQWAARIAEVGAGLYNLASRLPPLLEAKTQAEMGPIIKAEVRKLHVAYCRTGRFCFPPDETPQQAIPGVT